MDMAVLILSLVKKFKHRKLVKVKSNAHTVVIVLNFQIHVVFLNLNLYV